MNKIGIVVDKESIEIEVTTTLAATDQIRAVQAHGIRCGRFHIDATPHYFMLEAKCTRYKVYTHSQSKKM